MRAAELFIRRVIVAEIAEIVLWKLSHPLPGSTHAYKYRLALVADGRCVLRYDNEMGKGDHRHRGAGEEPYGFSTIERLVAGFF